MAPRLKPLSEQVVVVTGASSGIGLATAEMAARAGARVMLSSRNEKDLLDAVIRIRGNGGRAFHIVADVADPDAVDRIADLAIEQFGGIDTWVNNAGVGMYGKLTETPLADKRRLFEVDFWGVVHGCRTAVRHMRVGGGAIVNVGSVTSDRAAPLLGIYSAAKHAVKAYTDTLRMELEHDRIPISVSLIKPASINTPFIEHARSHMDTEPEFMPPVYPPEEVARAILACAERRIRDVLVGGSAKFLSRVGTLAPRTMEAYMHAAAFRQQKSARPNDGVARARRSLPLLAAGALAAGLAFALPRRTGNQPDAGGNSHGHT